MQQYVFDYLNRVITINSLGELKRYAGLRFSREFEAGTLRFHNKLSLTTQLRSLALVRVN